MRPTAFVPVLMAAALTGACGSSAATSSGDVASSSAVVVAELRPGSTGADAAALTQRYVSAAGVLSTHGDAGTTVQVFLRKDARAADLVSLVRRLKAEPRVARVESGPPTS